MKYKPEPVVKKEYKEKSKPSLVRFNNDFIEEFFIDEKTNSFVEMPINAMRIIFNIIATIREEQIYLKDNQAQLRLSLFDDQFLNENNTFARFKIKNSSIVENGKIEPIKKAFKFLRDFKLGWYKTINKDGKTVETLGGLIENPTVLYGHSQFLVSSYWLKKLIELPTYNTTLYNLVYNISDNKKILLFFWINSLHDEGTSIKYETLNKKFNLNYKDAKSLSANFLKNSREEFDKYSHKSFNYNRKKNIINIVPYATKTIESTVDAEKEIVEINYRISYIKQRHSLNKEQATLLKLIIKNSGTSRKIIYNAYKSFVDEINSENRKAKKGMKQEERKNVKAIKTTDFQKEKFLKVFQKHIDKEYRKTKAFMINPKGNPRLF